MVAISTALYSTLTIIFVPALIILIYMMIVNSRYNSVINVFGIAGSGIGSLFMLAFLGYLFLTGLVAGELPVIWKSMVFLLMLGCSSILAVVICKILRFMNRDKIKYAEIILQDEEIQDKILQCSQFLDELQRTSSSSVSNPEARKINREKIDAMRETIDKLVQIHNELQEQKIVMNAEIGAEGIKRVQLASKDSVNKKLDRELGRFSKNRTIDSSYRDIMDIMVKYNV